MKNIKVESERLILAPRSMEEMELVREAETDGEMKKAYEEMIAFMKKAPDMEEWTSDWRIVLKGGRVIGGIGFKGAPDEEGKVEVGYGINEEFRCHGYAAEALGAIMNWCFEQPGVQCVQAQTDPENRISQKVLRKNGFVPNGYGEEGPMFEVRRTK